LNKAKEYQEEVSDYYLKPMTVDDLHEFSTIKKATNLVAFFIEYK
jgi:hypothetical protein